MSTLKLTPANDREAAALGLFAHVLAGLGQMDVLALGLHEGGVLADAAALPGGAVLALDPDGRRVLAAREASACRLADATRHSKRAIPHSPRINQGGLDTLREKHNPGSFDVALVHLELARVPDLTDAFDILYWLLRTDGLAAVSFPHPCFAEGMADYFAAADLPGGAAGLPGPLYHRPITQLVDEAVERGFQLRGLNERPGTKGRRDALLLLEFGKDKWAP